MLLKTDWRHLGPVLHEYADLVHITTVRARSFLSEGRDAARYLNDRHLQVDPAIEDIYGSDLLCWTTNFFIKEANTSAYVSWHQDSTYWGLSAPDVVSAWVALTDSNETNGAMAVMPGTHLMDQIPHKDTFSDDNLLTRGQEVAVQVAPRSHDMEAKATAIRVLLARWAAIVFDFLDERVGERHLCLGCLELLVCLQRL